MARYRPGTAVKLREPLRRSRRHRHGPVRVKRGARGRVMTSNRHWRKGVRYDVSFKRWRRPNRVVRSVPAGKLARLLSRRGWALILLGVALTFLSIAPDRLW